MAIPTSCGGKTPTLASAKTELWLASKAKKHVLFAALIVGLSSVAAVSNDSISSLASQAPSTIGVVVENVSYRRVGLVPPSCDDRKRIVLRSHNADDASVRHNQLVRSTRHNFKGYVMKPRCVIKLVAPGPRQ